MPEKATRARSPNTAPVLYMITTRSHPELVKVGRTSCWPIRRKPYTEHPFGGIVQERLFSLLSLDDMRLAERVVLQFLPFPRRQSASGNGSEWFEATIEDVETAVRDILTANRIMFADGLVMVRVPAPQMGKLVPPPENSPEWLTEWRHRMGLSQRKAAEMLGCSRAALINWENGEREPPRYILLACMFLDTVQPLVRK